MIDISNFWNKTIIEYSTYDCMRLRNSVFFGEKFSYCCALYSKKKKNIQRRLYEGTLHVDIFPQIKLIQFVTKFNKMGKGIIII